MAGDARRAEVDDLHRAGAVDHDVVGLEVLMDHFQPVEGLQALGDLLENAAHGGEIGPRVVDHPLGQRLAFDEFADDVDASGACRVCWQGLRTCALLMRRAIHSSSRKRSSSRRVALQVDGRRLDDDALAGFAVDRKIDVAAAAALDFANDLVAVEIGARRRAGAERQFGRSGGKSRWPPGSGSSSMRTICDGQVVAAAALVGFFDDGSAAPSRSTALCDRRG